MGRQSDDARRLIKVEGQRLGHIPAFDGIRGLFVLQVVLYHAQVTDFLKGSPIIIDWFFVSSGFLITSLLLDENRQSGRIDRRRFYSRRALRLFPAMYLMLAVVGGILLIVNFVAPDALDNASMWWVEILTAALYVYFIVAAFFPGQMGIIGHTWSLTVEEQFYFFWPQLLGRTLKKGSRRADLRFIGGCVLFIAVFMTLRVALQHVVVWHGPEASFTDEGSITAQGVIYRIVATRPDSIVLGCLVAVIARAIPRPVPTNTRNLIKWLGLTGWGLSIFTVVFGLRVPGFDLFGGIGYQVALLFLAPMFLDMFIRPDSLICRGLSYRPFRWLGLRCYGIYLWHVPVLLFFLPLLNRTYGIEGLVYGLIASALGVGAGLLSYRYIEQRFNNMKEIRFGAPQDRIRRVVESGPAEPETADADGSSGSNGATGVKGVDGSGAALDSTDAAVSNAEPTNGTSPQQVESTSGAGDHR